VASIERMLCGLAFGYRARKTVLDRSDRHIAKACAAPTGRRPYASSRRGAS
jgi:hypothetical protein